ncbi:GNAT family N-acetyltransferase [Kangiella shandongensis]|uniref:GNAT family N-acetyltransferase n=1 Tax=Kangiella shandongensis TaxID=2763258 RepID=UPI001CC06CD0|nr:GNAT family N-acetyltransferase [Kangiella shandongensis]
MNTKIRTFTDTDWPLVWPIIEKVCSDQESFTYPNNIRQDLARAIWIKPAPDHTVVAVSDTDEILGTAKMGPNQMGPGSHIATASFMVAESYRGFRVGRKLGEFAVNWAKNEGYHGMQFNAVTESNKPAVNLWLSLGFDVIGTVPGAFNSKQYGSVGLHIMYKKF